MTSTPAPTATLTATAKAQLYIGTTTPMADATSYAADTWIAVGKVNDLGTLGDSAAEVKFETIDDGRVHKLPGVRDAGDMSVVVGFVPADVGQIAMRAAADAEPPEQHNFKVTLNDTPAGGTPTTFYFAGMILDQEVKLATGSTVIQQTFKISINTAIVRADAATVSS